MVNADDLPQEIVQPLLQLGRALMAHARAHRGTSLADHEDGVLAAWRVVAPVLLEGVLQVATTQALGLAPYQQTSAGLARWRAVSTPTLGPPARDRQPRRPNRWPHR